MKILENGFALPEVGLGTWKIGGEREADHSRDEEWVAGIRAAIAMGYTHIDTAAMYGVGHAEELVGQAIKGFDRSKLTIATKVFATQLAYEDFIASAKASIKRLDVEYVDIIYIHAPNPDIPLSETIRAMDTLVADGLAKHIAVSNFTVDLLKEAQSYTSNKIVANQIEYNLATREKSNYGGCEGMQFQILPYCQENDILIVAYRPIDRGAILDTNQLLDEMAAKYNVTPAQIAVSWLTSQKNVVTIPMATQEEHLKHNLEAGDIKLDDSDVKRLSDEYPFSR